MSGYFTRERFGRPQFLAGLLLMMFLAQASCLVKSDLHPMAGPLAPERDRIEGGWRQWHGEGIAGTPYPNAEVAAFAQISEEDGYDTEHSPLLSLVSAAPLLALPERAWTTELSNYWRWLPRLPFLACGVFLGASLWYVARRLCGNQGGFVALALYCFSPAMIQASAVWHTEPEIVTAWGAFGAIFTAIAVAHTLYAPREVVLWNWRRILLLAVALAIATSSQFSMIVVVPLALVFLLYVAPVRRRAGLAIWLAACVAGFVLLFATYFFHRHAFVEGMRHASFWGASWRAFADVRSYRETAALLGRASPAFLLALPLALVSYALWPRTRYFGNTAPLSVALLFMVLGMAHLNVAGAPGGTGFLLAAVPFLFVFVAGVLADLMETRYRPLVTAGVVGLVAANAVWSLVALGRVVLA